MVCRLGVTGVAVIAAFIGVVELVLGVAPGVRGVPKASWELGGGGLLYEYIDR